MKVFSKSQSENSRPRIWRLDLNLYIVFDITLISSFFAHASSSTPGHARRSVCAKRRFVCVPRCSSSLLFCSSNLVPQAPLPRDHVVVPIARVEKGFHQTIPPLSWFLALPQRWSCPSSTRRATLPAIKLVCEQRRVFFTDVRSNCCHALMSSFEGSVQGLLWFVLETTIFTDMTLFQLHLGITSESCAKQWRDASWSTRAFLWGLLVSFFNVECSVACKLPSTRRRRLVCCCLYPLCIY